MNNRITKLIQVGILLLWANLFSQNSYQADIAAGNYTKAIEKAKTAIKANPTDSLANYILGLSNTKLGNPLEAITYLDKAKKQGFSEPPININLARNYLKLDKPDIALDLLQAAADLGMFRYNLLEGPEFSKVHKNKRFLSIKEKMKSNAFPCKSDKNSNRFGFWVGDWDVYVNGQKIAQSKISYTHGNCAVLEDYKTLGVIAGNSTSYYDSETQKWKQTYIGAAGRVSHYIESDQPYEGDLQFISKSTIFQGVNSANPWIRMTYFKNEDGSVRQYLETSIDEGKNWTPNFDGIYKKS